LVDDNQVPVPRERGKLVLQLGRTNEGVLMAHPAVHDAAPVVVPDPDLGQRMAGFVQLADGAQSVDLNEILAFASERFADYKVPEALEIVDKIPRNALGKIDRQLLLAML